MNQQEYDEIYRHARRLVTRKSAALGIKDDPTISIEDIISESYLISCEKNSNPTKEEIIQNIPLALSQTKADYRKSDPEFMRTAVERAKYWNNDNRERYLKIQLRYRERLKGNKEKHNLIRNKMNKHVVSTLSDGYVRAILRAKGFKLDEITDEMIIAQRIKTQERRRHREEYNKSGKQEKEKRKIEYRSKRLSQYSLSYDSLKKIGRGW